MEVPEKKKFDQKNFSNTNCSGYLELPKKQKKKIEKKNFSSKNYKQQIGIQKLIRLIYVINGFL